MDIDELHQEIKLKLNNIIDTDFGKSLGELKALKNVFIESGLIEVEIQLIQPIHRAAEKINAECIKILSELAPDFESEISFTEVPMDYENRELLKKVKNIIAVASGKGGVGKSAIAANIAAALSLTGASTGILDSDIYGPSQPTMFGLKDQPLKAEELPDGTTIAFPNEKYGIKIASMGFVMNRDDAAIVRGPLLAGYFSMLFEQIDWGILDYLIFDLPPGTGDIQLTLTQKIPLTGAVIVTTPQEIAIADVRRSISMFKRVDVDILGIIENMSYFSPPDDPEKKYYIFGKGGGRDSALEYDIPFLGEVPLDIRMREGNDSGMPVVLDNSSQYQSYVLKQITENLIKQVRKHNLKMLEQPEMNISI
jgi:ATP-binding protein involved in chromosome partitioning